ncbi:MAG: HD domain-containing protein, partial [Nitrospirae bacterium]|nr:HD domain-containing protein [Nitrospirota bacterium]
ESATDIQGRTADLIKTGQQMEAEISRQKQADEELQKLLDESALHVQELTAEIERANQKLEAETAGRKQAEDELQKLRSESAAEGQGCIADLLKTNQQLETKLAEHRRAEDKLHILFEEIKHEADRSKSLLQIVEALNLRPDTGEIVKNVLDLAPKYLNLDRGCIFIYDEDNKDFSFTGGYGLNHSEENALSARTFTLNDFPAADKILQGSPVSVENTRETGAMDKEIVKIFNIVNAVIAPIAFERKVTGLFYGDFRSGSPIEPREVSFLKKLSGWLGVAVHNSRHYKESVKKQINLTAELETIKTMSLLVREVLSTLDKARISAAVSQLINRVIPCERSALLLKEKDVYRVISEWGIGKFQDKTYNTAAICGDIELKQAPVFIADISMNDEKCLYHKEQNLMGIRSAFIIPLLSKGEIIGLLDIGFAHMGVTSAYFTKAENIASQIALALEHAKLYEDLENLLINMTISLASALDAKSTWSKGHSERVAKYAAEIAKEMGLNEDDIENLRLYGLLHDIGQIGMYDILLNKQRKFTDEEYEHVKKHPQNGAEILESIKQLSGIIPGIRHHHERYDGKGYPSGLRGEDIPLYERILRVADSFDAMTADRPYRSSFSKEFTVSELQRLSGAEFDPKVVGAFLKVLDRE